MIMLCSANITRKNPEAKSNQRSKYRLSTREARQDDFYFVIQGLPEKVVLLDQFEKAHGNKVLDLQVGFFFSATTARKE